MRHPAHVAFAVLALVWGSNFLFMKWAVESISPAQTTLLRVLFGFVPVAAYALRTGALSRSHVRHVHHFAVMSVLATSVYYFAFASGAALLPSGIAGALAGSIPLFSLVGAAIWLRGERLTPSRVAGVLVGFGGVVLVARPWEAGAVSTTGVLWMALGSATVGLSFVYAKRFLVGLDIPAAGLTTYQMGLGLITLALVTDLDGITAITGDARALAGLVIGLGVLGTGLAYILYYLIVEDLGAVTAASATYLPPVVALAIGWLLAGEAIGPLDGLAVLLILGGVVTSARPAMISAVRDRLSDMVREFDAPLCKGDNPGAWTCVIMDDVAELFGTRGLVKIRGAIDGEPFDGALMAQGDGTHRLPVRASLRKVIGKEAGDTVRVRIDERIG